MIVKIFDVPIYPSRVPHVGNRCRGRLQRCEYSQYFPPFSETVQNLGVNSNVWTMLESQQTGMTPRVQNSNDVAI
jgi:hypothetical protein